MIQIRTAKPGDADAITRVSIDTFVEAFGDSYRPEDLAAFLAEKHSSAFYEAALADPAQRVWLAEDQGRAVGYAFAGPCELPVPDMPARSGELARLYVRAEAHGGGVGQRLLGLALGWLEETFDHLYIGVWSENYGAQRLYARRGFVKLCEYHFMVGAQADLEWIMARTR